MAPEILLGRSYNQKADMWSIGLILFIMLTGKSPFLGRVEEEIRQQTKDGFYNKRLLYDLKISNGCMELIEKLLDKNAMSRLSAEEALQLPWVNKTYIYNFYGIN